MPNPWISGIPNSAGPLPGATKNLHLTTLHFCLILTMQMPNCSMFEIIYILNTTVLFLWHATHLLLTWEYLFEYFNGIKLPSAPVWTLYTMSVHLWFVLDSNLVNITDLMLSRLMYFTLMTSPLLSCYLLHLHEGHLPGQCHVSSSSNVTPAVTTALTYILPKSHFAFCTCHIYCHMQGTAKGVLCHRIHNCPPYLCTLGVTHLFQHISFNVISLVPLFISLRGDLCTLPFCFYSVHT